MEQEDEYFDVGGVHLRPRKHPKHTLFNDTTDILPYADDNASIEEIAYRFAVREQIEATHPYLSEEEINHLLFNQIGDLRVLPEHMMKDILEVDQDSSEADDEFVGFADDLMDDDDIVIQLDKKERADRRELGPESYKWQRFGYNLERWPIPLIKRAKQKGASNIKLSNMQFGNKITSTDEYMDVESKCQFHLLPRISPHLIKNIIPKQVDVFILDPPLNNNYSKQDFAQLLTALKLYSPLFVFIWVDHAFSIEMHKLIKDVDLLFCDNMCVELLDGALEPLKYEEHDGCISTSRSIWICQFKHLSKNELVQQSTTDVNWGICGKGLKSRGRYSMPLVGHAMAEATLPPKGGVPRTFVEIWPSRSLPRAGWIYIDEEC